ncbi:MAG: DUF255 domain-containing protein [Planctomycetes bacterium]|nr:DUF255 domain-containing protein [Planctomycetota bacterium]
MGRPLLLPAAVLAALAAWATQALAADVRWRAWEEKAFAEAKERGKPILLIIDARWSPRSAEMQSEVFGDGTVALLVNEWFVPVRIDRDERPDIDVRYQAAVRSAGGNAGWPLVAFLTPAGEVIFGGTHFRLRDDFLEKRPAFETVLRGVAEDWEKRRDELLERAKSLEEKLRAQSAQVEQETPKEDAPKFDAPAALKNAAATLCERFDPVGGGFGPGVEGPKFPPPQALELLLLHHARSGDAASLNVLRHTLAGMLAGGIHDRLGGGFHRVSIDRLWRVPRFEKLLGLNAEMLQLLVHAWQFTKDPDYREAAEGVLQWMMEALADRERGGFFAGQLGEEPFYTWTLGELEAALAEDEGCGLVRRFYEIEAWGDLPETNPHRNVLFKACSIEEAAKAVHADRAGGEKVLREALQKLRAARQKRPAPPVDRRILVDANARAISACLLAAGAFARDDVRAFALKTLDRLLKEATDPAKGAGHVIAPDGSVSFPFLANDEAALALACTDAYLATGDDRYFEAAEASVKRLDERFLDAADGCYADRALKGDGAPPALGRLSAVYKPLQDSSLDGPSVNALAAMVRPRMREFSSTYRRQGPAVPVGAKLEALGAFAPALCIASVCSEQEYRALFFTHDASERQAIDRVVDEFYGYPSWLVMYLPPDRPEVFARLRKELEPHLGAIPKEAAGIVVSKEEGLEVFTDSAELKARLESLRKP